MKDYPNIEPSAFHRGEYVGYADGPWHIKRYGKGWKATKVSNLFSLVGRTLEEISYKLYQTIKA